MRTGTILLCAIAALTAVVLRTVDISDYLVATGILAATSRIQACESASHTSAPVAAMERNKADAALVMAAVVHTQASQGSCDSTTGSAADISFRYSTGGENCHSTARLGDIRAALEKALHLPGKDLIQSTMCLKLEDTEKWKGFLAYGHSDVFDSNTTCDDTLTFSKCVSGEKAHPKSFSGMTSIFSYERIMSLIHRLSLGVHGKDDTELCAVSTRSFGQIAYRYYATGPRCATMSKIGVIEETLHHQLLEIDAESIKEPVCIHYDEGGRWDGWLLFGRRREVELSTYCGPTQ